MKGRFPVSMLLAVCLLLPAIVSAESWTVYTPSDGMADSSVTSIAMDRNGAKWFGTWGGGVSRFADGVWKTFSAEDGLGENAVWSVAADRDNVLWFAVSRTTDTVYEGAGVSSWDGTSWKRYTVGDGLADDLVRAIAVGADNAKWFGTSSGVTRYDGVSWKTWTSKDGLAHSFVLSLMVDRTGAVWAGTVGGVSRFDGISWKTWTTGEGLPHLYVNALAEDENGNIWAGTWGGGAACFDGSSWRPVGEGRAGAHIYSVAPDRYGRLWFGAYEGLSRFDGVAWKTWTEAEGLPFPSVSALLPEGDTVWMGSTDGGAAQFTDTITGVQNPARTPFPFAIRGSYPNPFNPSTTIEFVTPGEINATLTVYSVSGQEVRRLASGSFAPGTHTFRWDGKNNSGIPAASGVYLIRLAGGGKIAAARVTFLK